MFIKKSFAEEIAIAMDNQLVDGAINKQAEKEARLVKAADYLNAAAEIFDETGMVAHAELITSLIEVLAAKKSKKDKNKAKDRKFKNKSKKPAKKLTSEKMVDNLKEKGWMFDENGCSDHGYDFSNCSDSCSGDKSYSDDKVEFSDEDLTNMLDAFKEEHGEDFEDELDFDGFETRI